MTDLQSKIAILRSDATQFASDVLSAVKAADAEATALENVRNLLRQVETQNVAIASENVTLRAELEASQLMATSYSEDAVAFSRDLAAAQVRITELESRPADPTLKPWPKRICMNADYRLMKTLELYGPDTWIAPKVAFGNGVAAANAPAYYTQMLAALAARNAVIGRELSATTICRAADRHSYPCECMDQDQFNPAVTTGTYPGEPWRSYIDLTHEPTRKRQAELLAAAFAGMPYAFLDNGPDLHSMDKIGWLVRGFAFIADVGFAFIADVSQRARDGGTRLVWNFPATTFAYLKPHDWIRLLRLLRDHAIMCEQPYPPIMLTRPDLASTAANVNQYMGDCGVPYVMLQADAVPLEQTWRWAGTWKRTGIDRVYLTWAFNEPEPEWLR